MKRRVGWRTEFEDPIHLPDGKTLVTLRHAADYIVALPTKDSSLPDWQIAMQMLINAADKGWPRLMARIGFMQALHRDHVRVFKPSEKKTHWAKVKLLRDR